MSTASPRLIRRQLARRAKIVTLLTDSNAVTRTDLKTEHYAIIGESCLERRPPLIGPDADRETVVADGAPSVGQALPAGL
jgi:hypothetical protein